LGPSIVGRTKRKEKKKASNGGMYNADTLGQKGARDRGIAKINSPVTVHSREGKE